MKPFYNLKASVLKKASESWRFQVTGWIHLLIVVFTVVASPSALIDDSVSKN